VRKLWRSIADLLELGMRQQMTRAGLLYAAASVLVGVTAFVSANNLLFLVLAAMMSTLLVSGFISRLSLAGLELDFLFPEHVCAGRRMEARIVIRNVKNWMPSFSIHFTPSDASAVSTPLWFVMIPRSSAVQAPVEIFFARRGLYRESSFRFATRFPFGFAERRTYVHMSRELIVYPSVDPQPGFEDLFSALAGDLEAWARGLGHDLYRIRPYEAFENARHVDWKATAHTGELQVREFARQQDIAVEIWLDLKTSDEEWLERAVSLCAFTIWRLNERGAALRLCTQNFDARVPEDGDVYSILRYLALASPSRANTLSVPEDENVFRIVLSRSPEVLAASGWPVSSVHMRFVEPELLSGSGSNTASAAAVGTAEAAAGQDQH
jgi:uncharacterized protein (DUF58 family)